MAASLSLKQVGEGAWDFMYMELVKMYGPKGEAGRKTLEQMGFQVGTQLAER